MSSIDIIPGFDLSATDFLLGDTTGAIGETLSGLLSQTGVLDILGQGQVITHFSEYAFTLGNRTYRYIGDFVSTIDQTLLGSVSSVTGNFDQILIEEAGQIIGDLQLDDLVGLDLGDVTSLGLLGLNLGDLVGGLLSNLLGDGPDSLLGSVVGTVDILLETIQDLIDDLVDVPGVDIPGTGGDDDLVGTAGNDNIRGGAGNDTIHGMGGDDAIFGDAGNDMLYGDAGNDHIWGGTGNDQLWGGTGNDELFGNQGRDKLNGEADNDRLAGGRGRDELTGGAGADTFVFLSARDSTRKGADLITDFSLEDGDRLDFSHFKHAEFIGRRQFSDDRGEIQVAYKQGDTFVRADFNGDGKAEFSLRIDGHVTLTADDFVL